MGQNLSSDAAGSTAIAATTATLIEGNYITTTSTTTAEAASSTLTVRCVEVIDHNLEKLAALRSPDTRISGSVGQTFTLPTGATIDNVKERLLDWAAAPTAADRAHNRSKLHLYVMRRALPERCCGAAMDGTTSATAIVRCEGEGSTITAVVTRDGCEILALPGAQPLADLAACGELVSVAGVEAPQLVLLYSFRESHMGIDGSTLCMGCCCAAICACCIAAICCCCKNSGSGSGNNAMSSTAYPQKPNNNNNSSSGNHNSGQPVYYQNGGGQPNQNPMTPQYNSSSGNHNSGQQGYGNYNQPNPL